MTIRLRLLLSYTAMLMTTVIMFAIAAVLITVALTGDIRSMKDFYQIHYSISPLTEQEETLYQDLKYIAKNNPDQLTEEKLLQEYDFELRKKQAGLHVRKGNDTVFLSGIWNDPNLTQALPAYDPTNVKLRNTVNVDNRFYAYMKFDFTFSDGQPGGMYVIRELSPYTALTQNLFPVLIGLLFVIIAVANGLLYYFVTRSITKPLSRLRESAEKIRDGDLNFEIASGSNDEVGQLSQAFEDMRQRLKESIDLQLQYEDNRKQLIANISHDLKTPLTTIKGYIEGIRDGVPDTQEKMDKYTGTIFSKVVHMDQMIDELFLFSKLDLKRLPFTFEEVDLALFLKDCVDEYRLDLMSRGIEIELNEPDNGTRPIIAKVDREKLMRTMNNIISNSIKHMDKAYKKIEIRYEPHSNDNVVTVAISDNGIGIEPEAVPFIFDRFYCADPSRTQGGSGLGLAIAKQIVHGHSGEIWAESEQGQGTVITFTLQRIRRQEGSV
ncbi:sensor histidine kinase [Paenibacillus agilis]|uniref:histidine kinase n=1 Tax=Paenibacillus agilis TaxID=3020863 RepID=A0A559IKY9_9BACL|nr:HAMP domain-containing sensor histidine kinase [Paenibacillus agilis]TVX88324.1 HAMP domain-containing histidine kinase [Paenibacillus agilis]